MSNNNLKINKDEVLCTTYSKENGTATHILCTKLNADPNKMWILWSVDDEGKLKKVAQGGSPLKLEKKIDYLHKKKDDSEYEDDTI
jgi:hypothetical protein